MLLRSISKDIQWLKSFRPAVKIAGLMLVFALIAGAWYLGAAWWTTPVTFVVNKIARESPPLEIAAVLAAILLLVYIGYIIQRDRRTR